MRDLTTPQWFAVMFVALALIALIPSFAHWMDGDRRERMEQIAAEKAEAIRKTGL